MPRSGIGLNELLGLRDQEVEDLRTGAGVRSVELGEPARFTTHRCEAVRGDIKGSRQNPALGSHLVAALLGAAAFSTGE